MGKLLSRLRRLLLKFVALGALSGSVQLSFSQDWTAAELPKTLWGGGLASSADGSRLLAGAAGSYCYCSTNAGVSWVSNRLSGFACDAAASSGDGSRLVVGMHCGWIYTSTNAGVSWVSNSVPQGSWGGIASSADGNRLVVLNRARGPIYTSTNAGATWVSNNVDLASTPYVVAGITNGVRITNHWLYVAWAGVGSSADGSKLAAAGNPPGLLSGGLIFLSTNSGASWEMSSAPYTNWCSIASSADGNVLIAGGVDHPQSPHVSFVFVSTNSGATWKFAGGFPAGMVSVASSADGRKLVAAYASKGIYTSADSGGTWTLSSAPNANWIRVASCADGSRLVAVVNEGGLYMWQAIPRLNLAFCEPDVVLSWSNVSSAANYALETCDSLSFGVLWSPLTNEVRVQEGNFVVTNRLSAERAFYRLRKM